MFSKKPNYTPLKKKGPSLVFMMEIFGVLILFVALAGYLYISNGPQTTTTKAHVFNSISKCGVDIGSATDSPSGMGGPGTTPVDKYSVTYVITNKRNQERRVRIREQAYGCPFTGSEENKTCGGGRSNNKSIEEKEYVLEPEGDDAANPNPGSRKTVTLTASQPLGQCGMFQIDINLLSVYKDGAWDDTCTNVVPDQYTGIGGLYWNPDQCNAPSPTPENTPTPSQTVSVTPSPTPQSTPVPSDTPTPPATNTPIPTATLTPSPGPSSTPGPSLTPVPVACGTKACNNATNPCMSGYSCLKAKDEANYCMMPEYQARCYDNPTFNNCCVAPNVSPTETVLVQTTSTPAPSIPAAGIATFGKIFTVAASIIILIGLLL